MHARLVVIGKSFDGEQFPREVGFESGPPDSLPGKQSAVGSDSEREGGGAERKLAVIIDATEYKANTGRYSHSSGGDVVMMLWSKEIKV